jgi:hypothetical protein
MIEMRVIDVDPEILRQAGAASAFAFEQSIIHIEAEIKGVIPELMETIVPEGPYGYTIMPQVLPDGSVNVPVITTREGIREAYELIRGMSDLLSVTPLTEIRGSWYTFQDNISRGARKATGEQSANQTLALFPSGQAKGITGELVWVRVPRSALGTGPAPVGAAKEEWQLREEVFLQHERYLQALRIADVDALIEVLNDGVQSAVRDYVNDTGTITSLDGKEAHRSYYQALFDKYEILSVEPLYRAAEDWYVFGEFRMTVRFRGGTEAGKTVAFHRAEFHIPAKDGRFIARIGHGTDPA